MRRSLSQRRKKLLSGFLKSFDVITSPERLKPDPGSYVLPATYPEYHPKKGQNDPNAGKPDLYALCKAFYPEWHHRIKSGQIKSVPRGSVYHVDNDNSEPENAITLRMMTLMKLLSILPLLVNRLPVDQYVEYVVVVATMVKSKVWTVSQNSWVSVSLDRNLPELSTHLA